jgi:hypothetical protein
MDWDLYGIIQEHTTDRFINTLNQKTLDRIFDQYIDGRKK